MKRSVILREAAERLWDGETSSVMRPTFICCVLPYTEEVKAIRTLIQQRLEGNDSVYGWLHWKGCINNSKTTKWSEIQAYRKAWCLHLADEYEANGD